MGKKLWKPANHDQFCLVFCTKMHYILTGVSTNLPYFPFKRLCKNLTAACPFDVILIQRIMFDLTNIILAYYTTCNFLFPLKYFIKYIYARCRCIEKYLTKCMWFFKLKKESQNWKIRDGSISCSISKYKHVSINRQSIGMEIVETFIYTQNIKLFNQLNYKFKYIPS